MVNDSDITMSAWLVKDKQWMESRKEQWLEINQNLECTGLSAKETKRLQGYYLKGLKPEDVNLVFKLWFHPDRSHDNLMSIRQRVTSSDFADSAIFYNNNTIVPLILENAFMGGLEQEVFDLLYLNVSCADDFHFSVKGEYSFSDCDSFPAKSIYPHLMLITNRFCSWIGNYKVHDSCAIQYMVDIWYQWFAITKEHLLLDGVDKMQTLFKLVLFWRNPHYGYDSQLGLSPSLALSAKRPLSQAQLRTVDELYQVLETRELPECVKLWWQEIKAIA